MNNTEYINKSADELASELRLIISELQRREGYDLMISAISVPVLERLNIEAARCKLSRLKITRDFRFLLVDLDKEVSLSPVHKALYILFLNHEEGIEFKQLVDYRDELLGIYKMIPTRNDSSRITGIVDRLVNPVDNAINEKCSRIKAAFSEYMDDYMLSYYMISSHVSKHFVSSSRVWFKRLKQVTLPRQLVIREFEDTFK